MPSYVINGASRGIGFEFLRQLSADPANTVIGLVRNVEATETKVAAELKEHNVHIIHGDLDNYESLKAASEATAHITGGRLDYLIANGARLHEDSAFKTFGGMSENPVALEKKLFDGFRTNVVGHVHLFNLFVPLLRKGTQKKAVAISSGHADLDLVAKYEIDMVPIYAVDKAAMNAVVAKFSAEYGRDGILFMSISPGVVDTGNLDPSLLSDRDRQSLGSMLSKFQAYAPHFQGPMSPEESVKAIISVYEQANVANGDGGSFVSHFGTKQWI